MEAYHPRALGLYRISHSAIQNMTQFKLPPLLGQRPAMEELQRFRCLQVLFLFAYKRRAR